MTNLKSSSKLLFWTAALDFYMASFHDFLNLFSLIYFLFTWVAPLAFNDISFTCKNNNNKRQLPVFDKALLDEFRGSLGSYNEWCIIVV